ncbi:hypothetical protein AB4Z38_25115 [Arthrobacter sp. 2RAF6]|uniref:hypothetical protein n=1 Tax=Arthrobacter sp. 2RAF6 TaxID=3233002 RepID=UPI003F8F1E76
MQASVMPEAGGIASVALSRLGDNIEGKDPGPISGDDFLMMGMGVVPGGGPLGELGRLGKAAKSADELARFGRGWRATSFGDEASSFEYHFGKHGVETGVTREQYAQDALNWARNPEGTGKAIQLKDGTEGLRYRTPGGGPGGITDRDGNIITFWYR